MNGQFDKETGERIQENAGAPQPYFYQTAEPPSDNGPAGKKKKGWIFAVIAVIVIAVAGAVFAAVKSGFFSSDSAKVMAAITNTVNDTDYLASTLKFGSLFASDDLTFSFESETQGYEMEFQFLFGESQKQLLGSMDVPDFTTVDFQAELTEEQLRVQVPVVSGYIFTYDYTKPKSSFMQENFGYRLDTFDEMLKNLYSAERNAQYHSDLVKTIIEEGQKLEFEKAEAEEFEVDKQDRNCKGISTVITRDCIQNIMDELEIIYRESQGAAYGYDGYYIEDYFDELEENLEEMEDFDVTFFIYKNKLACIRIEEDGEEAELRFLGGDTRMQNMQLFFEGEELLRLEGETVESTEVKRFFVEGEEMAGLEYDQKNGDLDITMDNGSTSLSGNVVLDKDSFNASIDKTMVNGQFVDVKWGMSVKKGASFEKIEGTEFNLSQATEQDMQELFEELDLL